MDAIVITILSIVLMIAIGYFSKRIDLLSAGDVEPINSIVMNILLPCMIFSALYSADLSMIHTLGLLPFVILLSSFVTGIISFVILKKLHLPDRKLWSVLVTVMIANTAFMGYPVNLGVYGSAGFLRAIFCDIATMSLFLILSFVLALKFGGSVRGAFKKIALFPPLWGIVFGIVLNLAGVPIGGVLENTVDYLGRGAIPLIMISLGLSINLEGFSRSRLMIAFTSIFKLAVFPLTAFFVVLILGFTGLEFSVSIVEAAMPSGMLSLILAISYKLDFELASDCILANTLLSLCTLPVIIMLL